MSSLSSNSAARSKGGDLALPPVAVLAGLAALLGLELWAYALAGVFEYPLDDVYIHLAMADGIASGTYGIMPGEPASASSSILYPFLLLPFHGTELQRFLPLVWNVLALVAAAWLWGKVLVRAGLEGPAGLALAVLGPVCLNMAGLAFLGMEHEIQLALSLAVLLGLWRYMQGGGIAGWFVAAAILAPLIRYEGLALSLGVAGLIAFTGRPRAGVLLGLGVSAPVALFSGFLMRQGLGVLPSSVVVKMDQVALGLGPLDRVLRTFLHNIGQPAGILVAVLTAAAGLLALGMRGQGRRALLPLLLFLCGLAHLLFGQIGWMHRYEIYIVVLLVAGLLLLLSEIAAPRVAALGGLVALVAGAQAFLPPLLTKYVWAPRAIHLQQGQMARFAQDYLKAPVAVNDIGRVSWNNPEYVLDLWGLASIQARRIRTAVPPPHRGWAGPLAEAHGVEAAMIYNGWVADALPPSWVPLADLEMTPERGALSRVYDVTFYAAGPQDVARVIAALKAFAPTLPAGAHLALTGPAMK